MKNKKEWKEIIKAILIITVLSMGTLIMLHLLGVFEHDNKQFCEKCVDDWTDECDKNCNCLEMRVDRVWELNGIVVTSGDCILVREKTSCEKGVDSAYIQDNETCRQKTINEWTCADLWKEYDNCTKYVSRGTCRNTEGFDMILKKGCFGEQ